MRSIGPLIPSRPWVTNLTWSESTTPVVYRAYVEARFKDPLNAALIKVPRLPRLLPIVSLAQWQTGFRNQESRGTCYAFAVCAAMEAAYRRDHQVTLDLSEQFAFHANKAGELYGDYVTNTVVQHENNSSYWGGQGAADLVAKLARAAIPDEPSARYLHPAEMDALRASIPAAGALTAVDATTQESMDAFEFAEGHIPTAARQRARYRVTGYQFLPNYPSNADVQAVLNAGHEVIADIPGHCYLIIGYDLNTSQWLVKNSWGENAFIRVDFGDPAHQIRGGAYITSVAPPLSPVQQEAWWVGNWSMDHDGWKGRLVIRRTTDYRHNQGEMTKLGDYYRDGQQRRDVNGRVEDGGRQLHFWIADAPGRVQPGATSGQEFRAWTFSWDPGNAAGVTTWSATPFGVTLSRAPLGGPNTRNYTRAAWLGQWAMNHDGWKGRLHITSLAPFAASYTAADGSSKAVLAGTFTSDHELHLTIDFGGGNRQPFRLLGHTWEAGRFSGTTQWGGATFGVQGTRV